MQHTPLPEAAEELLSLYARDPCVCVLSEPPEPWRFGVSFWLAEDREHGRGLQFAATVTGGYTVVEYEGAEVAFY